MPLIAATERRMKDSSYSVRQSRFHVFTHVTAWPVAQTQLSS